MVRNYKRKTVDKWTKDDLFVALTKIKDNQLKISDAAKEYGISRATLYRQFKKFIHSGCNPQSYLFRTCGGPSILTMMEEDVLEKTVKDLRAVGFVVASGDIKRICFEYCDTNGIPNQFNQEKRMASDDWYYGFLRRHPGARLPVPGENEEETSGGQPRRPEIKVTSSSSTKPQSVKRKLTQQGGKRGQPAKMPKLAPELQPPLSPESASEDEEDMEEFAAGVLEPVVDLQEGEVKDEADSEDGTDFEEDSDEEAELEESEEEDSEVKAEVSVSGATI